MAKDELSPRQERMRHKMGIHPPTEQQEAQHGHQQCRRNPGVGCGVAINKARAGGGVRVHGGEVAAH